jgi:Leucine-rich repeat (LRR) protein
MCQLSRLQRLTLRMCMALACLPASLGCLASLRHLSISLCCSLASLPASLCGLPALQHLHLASNYDLLDLPHGLGGTLTDLCFAWHNSCDNTSSSSNSSSWKMSRLGSSLAHLHISGSRKLQELPASLGQLGKLRRLTVSDCSALSSLPSCLSGLSSLSSLALAHCPHLAQLPDAIASDLVALRQLMLRQCDGLAELPVGLGRHGQLSRVVLEGCRGLARLPAGLAEVPGLQLVVRNCLGVTAQKEDCRLVGRPSDAGEQEEVQQQQQCRTHLADVLQQLATMRMVAG